MKMVTMELIKIELENLMKIAIASKAMLQQKL